MLTPQYRPRSTCRSFHNETAIDLRLSRSALRAARKVFVVVPFESLALYGGGGGGSGGGAAVEVGSDGEPVVAAAPELPPLFLEDLGRLLGGRRCANVYVSDAWRPPAELPN